MRYVGSGVVNTLVGFAVIFMLMAMGVGANLANAGGYAVGFVLGFVISKTMVFRSNGRFVAESVRYLIAFMIAFAINLSILNVLLLGSFINVYVAQVIAAAGYTGGMYLLGRYYVFRPSEDRR
ncbi:GtrA family protein [Pseudomonas sp.]|uniref:GtrA family protein n=1 Tax=Pseudomonas sp. TaxID=306 RepID=UPI00258FADED|nr:GtrA family protein [Pseudomonas sp.]